MHEVGIYSAYYKFVFVYLTIKGAIVMSLFSRLSLWYRKDFARFQAITRKVTWLAVIAFIVTAVPGLIWGREIVTLVFGAKYVVSDYNWILVPLCLSVAFTYLNLLNPTMLLVASMNRIFLGITSAGALVNILLNLLLIPSFSYTGSAIATCCSEFLMLCLAKYFANTLVLGGKGDV
jgi:O-antigen/teichoic acid export membrane protein